MKMGLRIVASIINISFDGRPPVSLGTAVVDLLTIIPCSSDEMLGSVLCARKAHLFSEQERHIISPFDKRLPRKYFAPTELDSLLDLLCYKHSAPTELTWRLTLRFQDSCGQFNHQLGFTFGFGVGIACG